MEGTDFSDDQPLAQAPPLPGMRDKKNYEKYGNDGNNDQEQNPARTLNAVLLRVVAAQFHMPLDAWLVNWVIE